MKVKGLNWDTMTKLINLERQKLATKTKPVTDRHNSDHLQRCHSKCHIRYKISIHL